MGTTSYEQWEEEQRKNAPRYYLCGECGREFPQDQGRCIDTCGGTIRPVYSEDILNKEESDEEDLNR